MTRQISSTKPWNTNGIFVIFYGVFHLRNLSDMKKKSQSIVLTFTESSESEKELNKTTQKSEKNSTANKIIAGIRVPLGNSLCKGVWAEVPVLLETQRTTQFPPKSVWKLLRDCKSQIECLKDDRGICFCTRTPQIDVIIYCLKWRF